MSVITKEEQVIRGYLDCFPPHNREACTRLLDENLELFRAAPGSRANHQAYPGGYLKHVSETMEMARLMFSSLAPRFNDIPNNEFFSIRDVQLVMFLHDLEKPWVYSGYFGENPPKYIKSNFRLNKIVEYGIRLETRHYQAMRQVEGIRDEDYDPNNRGFTPLGAFCHTLDLLSARVFYG